MTDRGSYGSFYLAVKPPEGTMASGAGNRPTGRRRSWTQRMLAGGLLVAGLGTFWAGSSLSAGEVERLDGNLPVNVGASDKADIRSNNSPTVVSSPTNATNLVVVNRVDQPLFGCRLHASLDGGANWFETDIPFPEGEELPPRCFAADAAFAADGRLYVSFVTLKGVGNTPNAAWVASSGDGGRSLEAPKKVLGPLAFQLRLAAHPHRAERLYLTFVQAGEVGTLGFAGSNNPVSILRSDDRGSTWQGPTTVSDPRNQAVGPSVAVGPRGEVYVLHLDLGDDPLDYHGAHGGLGGDPHAGRWSLVLARSLDGGATWQTSVVDDQLVPIERVVAFFPPSPSLAVDPGNGRIYVSFHDGRGGDPDVWLWVSNDGGASFTEARRVNDTKVRDGTSQYLPRLAVASGGRLDVLYYDRRADRNDVMNEVSFQASFDGGKSFGRSGRLTTKSFDSRIGFGSDRGMPELGSRLGLVSAKNRALAVWADTRVGNETSRKQDLARAVATVSRRSPLRLPVQALGLAVALGGLVLLVKWADPRERWLARRGPERLEEA